MQQVGKSGTLVGVKTGLGWSSHENDDNDDWNTWPTSMSRDNSR